MKTAFLEWLTSGWDTYLSIPHDRFVVVCEDFIQRPGLEREWVKQPTAKVYGAVWMRAMYANALWVPSLPQHIRSGLSIDNERIPTGHVRDDLSAQAHAAHFCRFGYDKAKLRDWLD